MGNSLKLLVGLGGGKCCCSWRCKDMFFKRTRVACTRGLPFR